MVTGTVADEIVRPRPGAKRPPLRALYPAAERIISTGPGDPGRMWSEVAGRAVGAAAASLAPEEFDGF